MTEEIANYHAHIYFDALQVDLARALGEGVRARFHDISMGRVHLVPVGPHPRGSCQLTVPRARLAEALEYLLVHRGELTIFAHANTGDDLADHTQHVIWLGSSETLDLSGF
jgi:DOPA 4,5-dioxygenase